MSQQLINLNSDLKQLRDEGYQIEIYGGYLITHHIPYVTNKREIKFGKLVCDLTLSGLKTVKPQSHVMMFSGEHPCHQDGSIITGIQHATLQQKLGNDIDLNYSFSNKPAEGYSNYYKKVSRYAEIISAPAKFLDDTISEKPHLPIKSIGEESVFHYYDTNSSRANIDHINSKICNQRIAIVGLGGTGAYILDLVAKSCVKEIHIIDGDVMLNHNAFRAPSAISAEELSKQPSKVEFYSQTYSKIRKNIKPYNCYLSKSNLDILLGMDYVFLAIDDNEARAICVDFLTTNGIPLIDVGLGVNALEDSLIGSVRVTCSTNSKFDHLDRRIPRSSGGVNEYSTNIQIAELNAFNATLAVIKWKKLSGFYQDLEKEHNSVYSINVSQLLNEDKIES
ncbi:ThiF family adenylyltransferase [Marinifilum flexuosum]|uniref:ThiF family adenylyltransferase n=1 Tax=Marinifilum flexuosum TaxID=1117708 RepID=UPI00248FC3D3|nr:ThiF family adenylyltransferase [Marinifilum flexuosum]